MNIIYISPAQEQNAFLDYCKTWKRTINSSNQNYHNKMIHALSLTHHVDAISVRSISEAYCAMKEYPEQVIQEDNITWHLLRVTLGHKLKEVWSLNQQFKTIFKKANKDSIIITDTINPSCSFFAVRMAKKFKMKIVGMVTDSPTYISNVNRYFSYLVYSQANDLDGYICLTERLNTTFNLNEKPYLINEGIINEKVKPCKNRYGDYIFFGGSLLEKWGVYSLIEAYKNLTNKNIKLILAGHHYNKDKLDAAIQDNKNILFFKCLPVQEVQELQNNALICVNPRPFDQDIDDFSIPSKVLEYLSSGALVVSTPNKILEKIFRDNEIVFTSDDSAFSLHEKMEYALSLDDDKREEMKKKGKEKVTQLYSFEAINKKIIPFLGQILKDR